MTEVSIIVCTLDRATSLTRTLASIAHAIRHTPNVDVEVVLVNNGSTDDTQGLIDRWAAQMPFRVKAIYEGCKGLAIARNTAVAASEGALVVFTDDDCTLNSDYISRLRDHYAKDVTPIIRGGKVELGDGTDQPFSIRLGDQTTRMTSLTFPGGFIIGANMTMRRDVLELLGPFDTRFGAGAALMAGEDTEYIYRAHRAGIPVEYVPDMIVHHFHGRKDKASINRLSYGYHIADGALYAKYITDLGLLKHLYWTCRSWVRGVISGHNVYDAQYGRTYTTLIIATVKGMLLYWYQSLFVRNRSEVAAESDGVVRRGQRSQQMSALGNQGRSGRNNG